MRWFLLGGLVFGSLVTYAQSYGPGEIYYGGIRLQFSGQVQIVGTCSGPHQVGTGVSELRCEAQAGTSGRIMLTATRTPAGAVNIRAEALPPGWPAFPVASGFGTATTQYDFLVPSLAGQTFLLRFKAWTPGVIGELELRVSLVVRAASPSEPGIPPTYGPFTGATDASGRFDIPIPTLPNTFVTGTLTECTVRVLPQAQVSVTLVPKTGVTAVTRADQIGTVRVSSPGYPEATVTQLQLASSMDMFGRVYTTVGLGTVCLRPAPPPPTPAYGPIAGKTDAEGKFTGTLVPGVTVSGQLTECTAKPLAYQEFTLTPVPKGEAIGSFEDIAGFKIAVSGYQEAMVTRFSLFSLFGLTSYHLGQVCLLSAACPATRLRLLVWNTALLPTHALFVGPRIPVVAEVVAGNYDIVCLQEVFDEAGKRAVHQSWTGREDPGQWHPLSRGQSKRVQVGGTEILLLGAMPNEEGTEVFVGQAGDRYVLAGPDSYCPVLGVDVEATQDGGLMLLSRYPIVAASAMIWGNQAGLLGGEELCAKGALYARVQLDPRNADCYVHVFNVHLAARDPEFTGPLEGKIPHPDRAWEVRKSQILELGAFIKACTQDDRARRPVILCGDFNVIAPFPANWGEDLVLPAGVDPRSPLPSPAYIAMLELLAEAGMFTDAWREKHPDKPGFTWLGRDWRTRSEGPWGDRGNPLAQGPGWPQRLDYIFYFRGGDTSPLLLGLESIGRTRWSNLIDKGAPFRWGDVQTYVPSDHLGLTATFMIAPP
ncbi:MAG: endonuclease/exonuclease/phosphatase family protein [Candidatus Bipolaricaulota bacterium]|nr:endonuclease/exonuclease/phosphatase family protein [Candidatus Bipolaricaulota bacterium]MDW8151964.1 endonuclease/exonuclease/phosphatase family protein [Candidatus Bipolaricaulota bacterium]